MEKDIQYFQTVQGESIAEFKDRGSKFLAYTKHVRTEEEALSYLDEIRKSHPKANHHCFAYSVGYDRNHYRYNDDGEPSGTAGKPIYGQFLSADLYHVICVVVRYFGGTKLGVSGLINAYREAAALSISQSKMKKEFISVEKKLTVEYALVPHVRDFFSKNDINILTENYTAHNSIYIIEVPEDISENIMKSLASYILQRPIEDIEDPDKELVGITIEEHE